MQYSLKNLNEMTTDDLNTVMVPYSAARIIRRQSKSNYNDRIKKAAQ